MKVLLGIILIIGTTQVSAQPCSPTCLQDEVCNVTTSACECNSTYYNNIDASSLIQLPAFSCGPGMFNLTISECLVVVMIQYGYQVWDSSCFSGRYSADYNPDANVLQFTFSPANPVCNATVSVNDTYVTYTTSFQYTDPATNGVILYNDEQINYSCSYPLDMITSLDVAVNPVKSTTNISIAGSGNYTAVMALYKNSNYTSPYTAADTPIYVTVEQKVYVGVYVVGVDASKFSLSLGTCKATPTSNPDDPIQYPFIVSGCPVVGGAAVTITSNGISLKDTFSVNMFQFVNKPQVYLHCSVKLCSGTCPSTCPSSSKSGDGNEQTLSLTYPIYQSSTGTSGGSSSVGVAPWTWKMISLLAVLLLKVM